MKKKLDETWSYDGDNGPEFWHTLCDGFAESAKSPYQSPIALAQSAAKTNISSKLAFFYQKQSFTAEEFNRAIHFVPDKKQSYVTWENATFYLTDMHFHVPAEHVINNQQQDLEFHFVHMNDHGETLVVGVLFKLIDTGQGLFSQENDGGWQKDGDSYSFNPQLFLPKKNNHYHYIGTLTTPPTYGPIKWFVFEEILQMNRDFITSLWNREEIPANRRPLQAVNGRPIYYID